MNEQRYSREKPMRSGHYWVREHDLSQDILVTFTPAGTNGLAFDAFLPLNKDANNLTSDNVKWWSRVVPPPSPHPF